MADTIDITPNYEGIREWLKNVAATDLPNAIRINESMGCEGLKATELVEIHEERNGNRCPNCEHVNYKRPVGFTREGAAEFYCDGCDSFYKDFDVFPEGEDDDED
jgi:hypothetical protein